MTKWRLLKLETADAYTNMAIDEAIMKARIEDKISNTLRFYQWNPSAVSIGRFQNLHNEIYVDNCKKYSVSMVRRITGGGSVYHDQNGEITYCLIAKTKDLDCNKLDMLSAYKKICNGLNEAVNILGAKAEYRPPAPKRCPNITIDGKKISGNAQITKKDVLLQHGTFLMDIDHTKMFRYLKVPWTKTINNVIKVSKTKLTSVRKELQLNFTAQEAHQALIEGFQKALKIQLVEDQLTKYEKSLAKKIRKERFATEDWLLLGKSSI